jgi:hypothetical protein
VGEGKSATRVVGRRKRETRNLLPAIMDDLDAGSVAWGNARPDDSDFDGVISVLEKEKTIRSGSFALRSEGGRCIPTLTLCVHTGTLRIFRARCEVRGDI